MLNLRFHGHIKAFYRQLHIAYFDCATIADYHGFSEISQRAFAIHGLAVSIQLLQAISTEPLIVVRNGQRVLFHVRLPTYCTVHSFGTTGMLACVVMMACGIAT